MLRHDAVAGFRVGVCDREQGVDDIGADLCVGQIQATEQKRHQLASCGVVSVTPAYEHRCGLTEDIS